MLVIEDCSNSSAVTVLVRGGNKVRWALCHLVFFRLVSKQCIIQILNESVSSIIRAIALDSFIFETSPDLNCYGDAVKGAVNTLRPCLFSSSVHIISL